MSPETDASNAHALLNYIISNASLTGKTGKGHILVPLTSLLKNQDKAQAKTIEDTLMKITITVEWRDAADIDLEEEYNCELTETQELEDDDQ